jgi:hypothetical protein
MAGVIYTLKDVVVSGGIKFVVLHEIPTEVFRASRFKEMETLDVRPLHHPVDEYRGFEYHRDITPSDLSSEPKAE